MSAILETFYTLFKSDTSDLDKGLSESQKKAHELAEKLGQTDQAAGKLGGTLMELAVKGGALLGIGLSVTSLWKAVSGVAAENQELGKLAARFGTTADAIDEFIDAGDLLGISKEKTVGGLEALDRAVQDTALGMGRAKKVFEELGIEVQDANGKIKPITVVMEELQGKISKLDKGTQIRIMERLGLDPSLLKLFNADMGDLQKRMAAIDSATGFQLDKAVKRSQEFTKAQKEMKVEVATLQMYLSKLKEKFAVDAMPIFTKGLQIATEWFQKLVGFVLNNSKFVEGALVAIAGAITYFLLPAAIRGALAVVAMLAPFILIGLAVAAVAAVFALAYDDIMNFMEGNDSLIGQILEKWPVVGDIIRGVGDVFKWLAETVLDVLDIIGQSWKLTFNAIYDVIAGIFGFWADKTSEIGGTMGALKELVGGIFTYWIDLITQFLGKFGGIVGIAKSVGGAISGVLGAAKSAVGLSGPGTADKIGLREGQDQLATASAAPLASQSSGAIAGAKTSTKSTSVKIDNVNVQTQGTDAAGISKSIGDSLGAQMRQATSNYDDGVAI